MKFFVTTILAFLLIDYCNAQPGEENLFLSESKYIPSQKTIFYKLGESTIPIKLTQYGSAMGIFYINVHDNETTSVMAARSILETRGGILLRIENNNQRLVRFRLRGLTFAFDPNRIFSRMGIEQSLKENGRVTEPAIDETEKFAQRILSMIPDSISCIIALHNNTEGAYSIRSYLPRGDRKTDAKAAIAGEKQDIDDIAFTTDGTIYLKMANYGFNSIWQDNNNAKKDGSLSVYCGENHKRYVNIETQHGNLSQYIEMLEKLLDILTELKLPGTNTVNTPQ